MFLSFSVTSSFVWHLNFGASSLNAMPVCGLHSSQYNVSRVLSHTVTYVLSFFIRVFLYPSVAFCFLLFQFLLYAFSRLSSIKASLNYLHFSTALHAWNYNHANLLVTLWEITVNPFTKFMKVTISVVDVTRLKFRRVHTALIVNCLTIANSLPIAGWASEYP